MQPSTLTVISEDASLIAMCRDALRDLFPAGAWVLVTAREFPGDRAGICLWDYHAGEKIGFTQTAETPRWLFLVSPKDLVEFREAMPLADGSILLKPVTRAVLHAFLGSVLPVTPNDSLYAERDELLSCLLEANLKLQEYDQRRTNFLARAVHEFRVPLTALGGFCGLLSAGELGELNSNQLDALQRMQRSVTRMTRMTAAMFELSIAGQREDRPLLQEGEIADCLDHAIGLIQPLADEKDLRLNTANLSPAEMPLLFESEQIEQVLVNLLDNACKASPRHGAIEISGYSYFWERRFLASNADSHDRRRSDVPAPNCYRIDISDQGLGVGAEHIDNIFEEYTSYFGSQDRSGGGLGLAICRLIVERHKGRIWATSQPLGALFSFVLPYSAAKRAQLASPPWRKSQSA